MLEFLLKLTHKKSCKKEQCPYIQKQEPAPAENTIQIPEKIVAEIDYEKLANAIVEANKKIEEKKKEKEREEYEQQKANWQMALLGEKFNKDKEPTNWQIFKGLLFFKKENANCNNVIYVLFKVVDCSLLLLYEYVLYALGLFSLAYFLPYKIIAKFSKYFLPFSLILNLPIKSIYIMTASVVLIVFSVIIARIIRVARLQISNSENRQLVAETFNSLITFTALIVAIITMILT